MRKTVITMALFLGLIVAVMTGCTSSKPFEKIDVITYARAYGILETSSTNARGAILPPTIFPRIKMRQSIFTITI